MESIQESAQNQYQTEARELMQRHAAQNVELASQGLFDVHGHELNLRHLQEKAELLLRYPQEETALLALGRMATTDEGTWAITQARQALAAPGTPST